jgi:hypothetical protein
MIPSTPEDADEAPVEDAWFPSELHEATNTVITRLASRTTYWGNMRNDRRCKCQKLPKLREAGSAQTPDPSDRGAAVNTVVSRSSVLRPSFIIKGNCPAWLKSGYLKWRMT